MSNNFFVRELNCKKICYLLTKAKIFYQKIPFPTNYPECKKNEGQLELDPFIFETFITFYATRANQNKNTLYAIPACL